MVDQVQQFVQNAQDDLSRLAQDTAPGAQPPAPVAPPPQPQQAQPQPQPQAQPQEQSPIDLLQKSLQDQSQPIDLDNAIKLLNERLNQQDNAPQVPQPTETLSKEGQASRIQQGYADLYSGQNAPNMAPLHPESVLNQGEPGQAVSSEDSTNLGKAWRRLFGTDVNDPLQWTRTGTTLAGGLSGAAAGANIPGPPIVKGVGALAGGFLGTVSGAAAPEITLQALEDAGILKPGTRKKLGLGDKELYQVIEGEALLDIYTGGGVGLARGAGRGLTNLFTGATRQSKAMAEAGTREGIALMPVQVGTGRFARGFTSVMGHFPFIAGPLRRQGSQSIERIANMFEGIPQRLGPLSTFDEVSGDILREARGTSEAIAAHFDGEARQLFARADMQRLVVRPVATDTATTQVLREIDRMTPRAADGTLIQPPRNIQQVRDFLTNSTARLYQADANGMRQASDLPLRQLDTLIESIDQQIARAAKANDVQGIQWLDSVRQAATSDLVTHVLGAGGRSAPQEARQFMQQFAEMDARQTATVNELFANATAGRLGAKVSPNMRAARFPDQQLGKVDRLAEVLVDQGGPRAVDDLARLVPHETMQRLASAVFDRAVREGNTITDTTVRFDVEKFAERLGMTDRNSTRWQQTQRLLQLSGGLTPEQLDRFVSIARHVDGVDLPNVSKFIARRATFGGIGTVFRSFAAGAVILGASGAAGKAASGSYQGGLMGIVAMYGGARLISSMISNPTSARALGRVFDTEASMVVRRAAWTRAVMGASADMLRSGYNSDQVQGMVKRIREGFQEFDNMVKEEQRK